MRSVALIIVHFRNVADTLECLDSARSLVYPSDVLVRIVVVDNGSGDTSWSKIVKWACEHHPSSHEAIGTDRIPRGICDGERFCFGGSSAELVLLNAGNNAGYAAGCNRGLEFALADPRTTHLWLLNNDVLFDPHVLERLLDADERTGPAIFGTTMLYEDDPGTIQAAGGAMYLRAIGRSRHCGKRQRLNDRPLPSPRFDYVIGASMFFPRQVIDAVGLLPEHFFLYFEETEWCARVRENDFGLAWVPEARIIHKEGKSTGTARHFRRVSDLSFRYIVRNSLLFTRVRFPFWLPTVFLFNLCQCLQYCFAGDVNKLSIFSKAVREYWTLASRH